MLLSNIPHDIRSIILDLGPHHRDKYRPVLVELKKKWKFILRHPRYIVANINGFFQVIPIYH